MWSELDTLIRLAVILGVWTIARANTSQDTSPPSTAKLPVPDNSAQKIALHRLGEAYGKRLSGARKPADKAALAKDLLEAGRDEKDSNNRFVILSTARDTAAAAADLVMACQAVDELDQSFDVDALQMKVDAVLTAAHATSTAEQREASVNQSLTLLDQALSAERYELVRDLVNTITIEARQTNDAGLIQQASVQTRQANDSATAYAEVKEAIAALKRDPEDPEASLSVGRFRCFVRGDWDRGLPSLALGSDPLLKKLALADLARPESVGDQLSLADQWWDLAAREMKELKLRIEARATKWYQAALPETAGLRQAQVRTRLQEFETAQIGLDSSGTRELLCTMKGVGIFSNGIIVLRDNQIATSTDSFRPPIAFTIVAEIDSTNLRLRYAADQFIFNWNGNLDELRVDGGPADGRHKGGAGRIPVNKWVHIDLVVLPDTLTIAVDGKERYATKADFSKVDMPFTVFAAGPIARVKSIQVRRP